MRGSSIPKAQRIPRHLAAVTVLLAALAAAGCAAPEQAATTARPEDVVFYPPLPGEPRVQFLTTLSSVLDAGSGSQAMRDFVFGGAENEGYLVNKPYGVDIFDGAVFVTDLRGAGYGVFDMAGGASRFVRPAGAGALEAPGNITIDSDGTRYITDGKREQVLVFDRQDRFLRAIGGPGQFRPGDVCIVGDRLYISDLEHHQVQVLDKRSGELLLSFGTLGPGDGEFIHPTHIARGSDETIWVADTSQFRVQRFTLEGEYLSTVGAPGTLPGQFVRPKGVAVDREGHLYVVDNSFDNVQIFDEDGTLLLVFAKPGTDRHSLNLPTEITIDYDNVRYFQKFAHPDFEIEYLILVANQFGAHRVTVFGFGSMRE